MTSFALCFCVARCDVSGSLFKKAAFAARTQETNRQTSLIAAWSTKPLRLHIARAQSLQPPLRRRLRQVQCSSSAAAGTHHVSASRKTSKPPAGQRGSRQRSVPLIGAPVVRRLADTRAFAIGLRWHWPVNSSLEPNGMVVTETCTGDWRNSVFRIGSFGMKRTQP